MRLLLFKVTRVVALVAPHLSTIEFDRPTHHPIEKIPIVGHEEDGSRKLSQCTLQPVDRLRIEMVGRFIQNQKVWLRQKAVGERDPLALSARERSHLCRPVEDPQLGQHRLGLGLDLPSPHHLDLMRQLRDPLQELLLCPTLLRQLLARHLILPNPVQLLPQRAISSLKDRLENRLPWLKGRILWQDRYLSVIGQDDPSGVRNLFPRDHPQQGALSRTVGPDDPDLLSCFQAKCHLGEERLDPKSLGDLFYRQQCHLHLLAQPWTSSLRGKLIIQKKRAPAPRIPPQTTHRRTRGPVVS